MRAFLKQNKKTIFICGAGLAVAIGLALLMGLLFRWCKGDWAAFLGSYIGGIATLAAVVLTIEHNRRTEELEAKNNMEKSAFIIYHDFSINIGTIEAVMNSLLRSYDAQAADGKIDIVTGKLKSGLTELHIDPQWIRNVAELKECGSTSLAIQYIYEIYGPLQILENSLTNNAITDDMVINAVNSLVKYDKDSGCIIKKDKVETAMGYVRRRAGLVKNKRKGI